MTLSIARNVAIARPRLSFARAFLVRGLSSLTFALLLSSCGNLPWSTDASLRPIARRRAVPTSQRQEARMARPTALGSAPVVDYGVYKQINAGMELAEVQALLGEGRRHEVGAEKNALAEGEPEDAGLFWRWTHPSGVYNVHVRLIAGSQPETFLIQSKWLTYNPPE